MPRPRLEARRLIAAGLLLALPASVVVAGEKDAPPIRVLGVGGAASAALEPAKLFDVRRSPSNAPAPADLEWAEVVIVGPERGAVAEETAGRLAGAVHGGKGLVVAGAAAWDLPAPGAFSRLLGREPAADRGEAGAAEELDVSVREQSHPVTQCLTTFRQRAFAARARLVPGAVILAAAPAAGAGKTEGEAASPAPRLPVVWTVEVAADPFRTRALRPGRVLVSALDPAGGPSRGAAAAILARGVEWAAGRQVTARLEGEMALAASPLPERGFFLGREIAPVMSYHGADWLLRAEREETEQPERVIDKLGLKPGMTVADVGAGVGYFSLRLARRVAPGGKVLAVEIQEEMLRGLRERAARAGIENVEPILATADDPRLPEKSADLVLMVDVYHELARPVEVMAAVRKALRPGGRVVLVEYRGEDPLVPIKPVHRMTLAQARAELEAHGFRRIEVEEFLPHQRLITAAER